MNFKIAIINVTLIKIKNRVKNRVKNKVKIKNRVKVKNRVKIKNKIKLKIFIIKDKILYFGFKNLVLNKYKIL